MEKIKAKPWAKTDAKKKKILGMAHTTAHSRLNRMIMFDMAKKLDMDICYRCGLPIEHIEEFSVEHTESWMKAKEPIKTFFDLKKIAFSHLSCNCGKKEPVDKEVSYELG